MKVFETKTVYCQGGKVVVEISESLDDKIDIRVTEHCLSDEPLVRIGINRDDCIQFVFLKDLTKK